MFPPLQDLYGSRRRSCSASSACWSCSSLRSCPKRATECSRAFPCRRAALALASTDFPLTHPGLAYSGLLRADAFSLFVHWIVGGAAFLVILGSIDYLKRENLDAGEFCALILFATAGMGVMAAPTNC